MTRKAAPRKAASRKPPPRPRSLAARAAAARSERGPDLRRSAVLLAGLGAGLVALALAVLPWYRDSVGSSIVRGSYRDLRDVLTLAELYGLDAPVILRLYFGWLPAALLLGLLGAIAATLGRPPLRTAGRLAAPLLGAVAIVATWWALADLWDRVAGRTGPGILGDSRSGLWAILLGFALLGLAGAIGLRRR